MEKKHFIAEIGINHNGDIDIAKQLIKNSKEAGFDSVKFQKRNIYKVYKKKFLESFRESPWGKTQEDQKKGLEFGKKEYDIIDSYCKSLDINWFCSAWDLDSLEFLDQYDLKYHKIASAMIVDTDFLDQVSKRKKHTFISTGMTKIEDIKSAVEIFKKNNCSFELMHCVSTYPMKIENANLKKINGLRKMFGCDVGYSGHESGLAVSYAASMFGITSLERHVTLDRSMYGSDQSASLEKIGMNQLISVINKMQISCGSGQMDKVLDEEIPIAKKLREHLSWYDVDKHLK